MMAQVLIVCNYKELHNKKSFRGGPGLINVALNPVHCLFQFLLQVYVNVHVYV